MKTSYDTLKYKAVVAAFAASAAFGVHAETPYNWNWESGPQPAPYGITDPAPTPPGFKVAVFAHNNESGPQPAPYGVADPAPTPPGFKVAEFPDNIESGPQPAPFGVSDPMSRPRRVGGS